MPATNFSNGSEPTSKYYQLVFSFNLSLNKMHLFAFNIYETFFNI